MNTPGVTADLSHISSIATIDGYLPDGGEGIKKAFKGADIVVIPAGIPRESTSHTHKCLNSGAREKPGCGIGASAVWRGRAFLPAPMKSDMPPPVS